MSITNTSDFEVDLVQVLFRHGDRTPDNSEVYPNDPQRSFGYPPYGNGQLTNDGKRRAYKLGELLKNRYGTFLGPYEPATVYAYSTWLDRCKTSLLLVLAALFPPSAELTWSKNLNWMPIPFSSNGPENEIFYSHARNPRHLYLMREAFESEEIKEKTEKFNKTLKYLVEKTGCKNDFQVMSSIFQNIESKREYGLPTPEWCDEKLLDDLKKAHLIRFDVFSHTTELKKLFMGPFLQKVDENIFRNINKTSERKIYLYCAHDLTVHAFLRAHSIDDISPINYSVTVVLEKLRDKSNKQYVRLLLWPGDGEQFQVLKLKDCDEVCPLEEYLKVITPILS